MFTRLTFGLSVYSKLQLIFKMKKILLRCKKCYSLYLTQKYTFFLYNERLHCFELLKIHDFIKKISCIELDTDSPRKFKLNEYIKMRYKNILQLSVHFSTV